MIWDGSWGGCSPQRVLHGEVRGGEEPAAGLDQRSLELLEGMVSNAWMSRRLVAMTKRSGR
jgi:hypothetical protein